MKRFVTALVIALISLQAQAAQTWIMLGDSIGGAVANGQPSQHFAHLVAAERNIYIRNLSSAGASLGSKDHTGFNNTGTIFALSMMGGLWSAYDGIIIQAGTNDYSRNIPWQDAVTALRRIMDHARALQKKVLVLDPIWRAGEDSPNLLGNTLNAYRWNIAVTCLVEYADICRFANRANTVMGTNAGSANYDPAEVAQGAQTHPNAAGHRLIADWIKAEAAAAGLF